MSECIYQREGWLVRLRRSPIRQEMLFERFGAPVWRMTVPPKMANSDIVGIAMQATAMFDTAWGSGFEKARAVLDLAAEAPR